MALATQRNLLTRQMDVMTAFLNSPVLENIYVAQPQGFEIFGSGSQRMVLKL